MICPRNAGGPVIRHRRRSAALPTAILLALAACAGERRTTDDTLEIPAVAVPVSDSAADSAAREADEQAGVSPAASDTANRPLIRPAKPDTGRPRPVVQRGDSVLIELERTACLGSCPVYSVALRGDGSVRYQGRNFVKQSGTATAVVAAAAVRGIVDAANAANFFALPARYAYGEPTCPLYTTDSPRTFIAITAGGRTKRIEHDYGCENGPKALVALAARIDSVAGTARWIGPRE